MNSKVILNNSRISRKLSAQNWSKRLKRVKSLFIESTDLQKYYKFLEKYYEKRKNADLVQGHCWRKRLTDCQSLP